jgi:hypothetical protein
VRLVYDRGQFLLINLSASDPLDVSEWVFEQVSPESTQRWVYRADSWQTQRTLDPPNRMRPGGCFQLVTGDASQLDPAESVCPEFLGFFQTSVSQRYFWISNRPGAVFTVRNTANTRLFATCEISAGQCEFNTNDAQPIVPTPVPLPPTPMPTTAVPGQLRLRYDRDAFMVINVAGKMLDITGLTFEQELPNGEIRSFDSGLWVRPDIETPPNRLVSGGCYQVVRADGTQTNPANDLCYPFLGYFRTGVESRYFWIANRTGAVFTVRRASNGALLATCEIDAGECYVSLEE